MTNYGVLISTLNVNIDDDLHSSSWYDLVLMYKALKEKGYLLENIFVLYGEGIDFNTRHMRYNSIRQFNRKITQWEANKTNIKEIFSNLSIGATNIAMHDGNLINIPKITSADVFFVWWNGHGDHFVPFPPDPDADKCITDFETTSGGLIRDIDLVQIINTVNTFSSRVLVFQTCCSGGIISDFNSGGNLLGNTVIMTSANCTETSRNEFYEEKIFFSFIERWKWWPFRFFNKIKNIKESIAHSPFNYHLTSAIRGLYPDRTILPTNPDSDGNNHLSVAECFKYVVDRLNDEAANYHSQYGYSLSTPQLDNSVIAASLNLF